MVLTISQETFNEAVQENINDLGLSPEEAVEEAIKQFESQGANLNNIVKEIMEDQSKFKTLENAIKNLNDLSTTNSSTDKILIELQSIKTECGKGIQYKLFAGKMGAYTIILNIQNKFQKDNSVIKNCLNALIALLSKQPDLLDQSGIDMILQLIGKDVDLDCKKLALKLARECCILHEMNRQNLFNANILDKIKEILEEANPAILKETLSVCRALILDDDVRVEFGRAHEHARAIATETLSLIINLFDRFQEDETVIHDLMQTISALLVRTEFCQTVKDAGGIEIIRDSMNRFTTSEKINRQCFKLLKALAGNDECKAQIIQKGLSVCISNNLEIHKGNAITATAGLGCIAALSLRNPENSKSLFEAGIPSVILDVMRAHLDQKNVQKNASWAIRNMVSRSRYQNEKFLQLGAEDLLNSCTVKFPDIQYDIKAALRDLGCEVMLKEEWTGTGGMLTSSSNSVIKN